MKLTSATQPAIIAVTGLAKEARIAAEPGVRAIAGGAMRAASPTCSNASLPSARAR